MKRRALLLRDYDGLFALIDQRWRQTAERQREPLSRERFLRTVLEQALDAPPRTRMSRMKGRP